MAAPTRYQFYLTVGDGVLAREEKPAGMTEVFGERTRTWSAYPSLHKAECHYITEAEARKIAGDAVNAPASTNPASAS